MDSHARQEQKISDFHILRAGERKAQAAYEEERKQGDLFHLKHNNRCVCYAPRHPLYSSLWPLKEFHQPLELNNDPPRHDHRLHCLTGRFKYDVSEWKTIDILEYDFTNKIWLEVATMPAKYVHCHFQPQSWDYMQAYNYLDKIWIKRSDGQTQGAIYDYEKKTWGLDWRFPIFPKGTAWFHKIAPFNDVLNATPWDKYLPGCITHSIEDKDP